MWACELSMLNTVKCRIQRARQALVLTCAGMSEESGLPTDRADADDLWNQYAMAEVATANALRSRHWPFKFERLNPMQDTWRWLICRSNAR